MTIHLEEECGLDLPFDYKKLLETVIRKALDYERFPFEAEVSDIGRSGSYASDQSGIPAD